MKYRVTSEGYEMEDGMIFRPYDDGALTSQMVNLARAIALNLDEYTERQREAICRHALFCASDYQDGRTMMAADLGLMQ